MNPKLKELNNLNKKFGVVLWLTGLSGAGKSTLGDAIFDILDKRGIQVQRLDGNLVKGCFGSDFSFGKDDHEMNIKLATFISSVLVEHGVFVVASFVSPHKSQRKFVNDSCINFIEVYVSAPLDICIQRDTKGFYKRAINKEIENFPGFSYPYEIPENPHLVIDTEKMNVESSVQKLLDYLLTERYI